MIEDCISVNILVNEHFKIYICCKLHMLTDLWLTLIFEEEVTFVIKLRNLKRPKYIFMVKQWKKEKQKNPTKQ